MVNNRYRFCGDYFMGRPPMQVKATVVRLPEDVRQQIRELVGDSGMAKFIREAVERELKRRQRQK